MTKAIYIFLGIAVLAGLYLTFMGGESSEPAMTDTETEMNETEDMTTDDTMEMGSEEEMDDSSMDVEADASAEVVMGANDMGMEMPTPDEPLEAAAGEVRTFTVDAFNYGYSMDEIRVNEGDTVVINLTNSEGFHDWVLDEFGAATEKIQNGNTTSVTFVADAAGTYEYYCSVGNHRAQGMVGTLIVE